MSMLHLCDGDSGDGTCFDQSSIFSHEVVHGADTLLDFINYFDDLFPLHFSVDVR